MVHHATAWDTIHQIQLDHRSDVSSSVFTDCGYYAGHLITVEYKSCVSQAGRSRHSDMRSVHSATMSCSTPKVAIGRTVLDAMYRCRSSLAMSLKATTSYHVETVRTKPISYLDRLSRQLLKLGLLKVADRAFERISNITRSSSPAS